MNTRLLVCSLLCLWSGLASAACWKPQPGPKSLTFVADQAGAPFPGEFKSYTAQLCLDDKDAAKNTLSVQVDLNSVSTGLDEMDEALKGADFFDTAHTPQGSFKSDTLKLLSPGHYQVNGKLALRGVTREVTVPFTWDAAGGRPRLTAHFALNRQDFGIGRGQWADTTWVGNTVQINFAITFVPASQ